MDSLSWPFAEQLPEAANRVLVKNLLELIEIMLQGLSEFVSLHPCLKERLFHEVLWFVLQFGDGVFKVDIRQAQLIITGLDGPAKLPKGRDDLQWRIPDLLNKNKHLRDHGVDHSHQSQRPKYREGGLQHGPHAGNVGEECGRRAVAIQKSTLKTFNGSCRRLGPAYRSTRRGPLRGDHAIVGHPGAVDCSLFVSESLNQLVPLGNQFFHSRLAIGPIQLFGRRNQALNGVPRPVGSPNDQATVTFE